MNKCLVLLLSLNFLTACTSLTNVTPIPESTKVYLVPSTVAIPSAPKLETYNTSYGLDEPSNFSKFQRNMLLMTDYIISLQSTLDYYESEIDSLQSQRTQDMQRE